VNSNKAPRWIWHSARVSYQVNA